MNGMAEGVIETLAGANWTAGLHRNAYLRINAAEGTTITSVGIENLSSGDFLMLDHLAVPGQSVVPEPTCFSWIAGARFG
jgi:hypothetical protein